MRKLILNYLAIISPFVLFYFLVKNGLAGWVALALLIYAFLYRPWIDGKRLISLGAMDPKDFKKMFIPFGWYRQQYFKKLFWSTK